ncbi:MAG TPA: hypothetical protein VGX28_03295 [Frankiaceae bacterium]|jgi:hypothetical protein|nr:hypothetical protein [Frankiaceae bacterium]
MAARREDDAAAEKAERAVLRGDRRPKRNVLAKVGIGLVALLALGTAALARQPRPPALPASCDRPSFALASPAKQSRPLAYTMVGPEEKRYMLALNTSGFVRDAGGAWRPVTLPGRPRDQVVYVGDEPMTGCRRSGVLNLPVPLGEHVVTMYELPPTGSAVEVARQTVEVVAPDEDDLEVPR